MTEHIDFGALHCGFWSAVMGFIKGLTVVLGMEIAFLERWVGQGYDALYWINDFIAKD